MHVLHVINSIAAGGAELHLLTLCRRLRERGLRQTVAYLHERPVSRSLRGEFNAEGIQTVPVGADGRYNVTFPFSIQSLASRLRPDILHTHLPRADLAGGYVKLRHPGLPWIVSMHNIYGPHSWSGPVLLPVLDVVWRRADAIIAISEAVKDWLVRRRGIPPQRVQVIHYGIDPAPWLVPHPDAKERWGLTGRPVVGAIGRLTPHKGFATLVSAWPAVQSRFPDAVLAIAGWDVKGHRHELQALIDGLGLHDAVRLVGFVNDVPAFLAACEVFAFPTSSEGFGQVVIEAMAAARPVVASRIAPLTEIVVDGETGLLTPQGDGAAMAAALVRLLSTPDEGAAMGACGRRRVISRFSADHMADQIRATYDRLLHDTEGRRMIESKA